MHRLMQLVHLIFILVLIVIIIKNDGFRFYCYNYKYFFHYVMTVFYDIVAAFYEFLWNVQEINSSHKIEIKQNKKTTLNDVVWCFKTMNQYDTNIMIRTNHSRKIFMNDLNIVERDSFSKYLDYNKTNETNYLTLVIGKNVSN